MDNLNTMSQQPASNKTVLLIEDDPMLTKMYQTKFESEGYKVLIALNGEEGLNTALLEDVGIIILDLLMPKLSGLDFLTKLRQEPKGKEIPVLVLTNLTQKEDQQKASDLGVKEYLVKSNLTPTQVLEKVNLYLK